MSGERKARCAVAGCQKPISARGWCGTHYSRWRRTGDVGTVAPLVETRTVCQIDGCEKRHAALGYCFMHWKRYRTSGDPGPAEPIKQPARGCKEDGCERPHVARGFCRLHYRRWHLYGDQGHVARHLPGTDSHNWRGDDISYRSAHRRVSEARGSASDHSCAHCGKAAREWAYDHADPAERYADQAGFPYSAKIEHYMPLCMSCHQLFDNEHRKEISA